MEKKTKSVSKLQSIYEKLFCPEGRTNRTQFWTAAIIDLVLFLIGTVGFVNMSRVIAGGKKAHAGFSSAYEEGVAAGTNLVNVFAGMIWLIFCLAVVCFFVRTVIRRWHDMGRSDQTLLYKVLYPILGLNFVLVHVMGMFFLLDGLYNKSEIGFVIMLMCSVDIPCYLGFLLYLGIAAGTSGENAYGPMPAGNVWGVHITERTVDPRSVMQIIFSWKKRLTRKYYMFGLAGLQLVSLFLLVFAQLPGMRLFTMLLFVVLLIIQMILSAQRLHDLGMSAKGLFIAYAVCVASGGGFGVLLAVEGENTVLYEETILSGICVLLWVVAVFYLVKIGIQMILQKGDAGENAYGPSCLEEIFPAEPAPALETPAE